MAHMAYWAEDGKHPFPVFTTLTPYNKKTIIEAGDMAQ